MNSGVAFAHLGLPWPEDYRDLKPMILEKWGVGEEIYLHHQLSGKSGAAVYTTDIDSAGFCGQAILKLDHAHDSQRKEQNEAERHRLAYVTAPDYAEAHLPRILESLHHGQSIAILSTIAGNGLEFSKPWAECSHKVQLGIVCQLARGLLEDWNAGHTLSEGLRSPQELLWNWLDYRLDPEMGRIHGFLRDTCGIPPDDASFVFEGLWYPNPLAFAAKDADFGNRLRLRAVMGQSHNDLHGFNVLVSSVPNGSSDYYMIDLAMYEDRQYLFYDHAYFEISHLLAVREYSDAVNWQSLLASLRPYGHAGNDLDPKGDDLGLLQIVEQIQTEIAGWIDRHQNARMSYLQNQYLLARIAVGLGFTHKNIAEKARRMAFIYAAANLKDYLERNEIDWQKHGSRFEIDASDPVAPSIQSARQHRPDGQQTGPSGEGRAVDHYPPLPDKHSIAVLAFKNLSGDPKQESFSDGVSQEIITALSGLDWLMVIARGSSFTYKDADTDIRRIGRELGVHYVVAGTVRRNRSHIRISVQLIDARSGRHIWAERYDDESKDIFDLQEQIARAIAANVDSRLKQSERGEACRTSEHLGVWEKYQDALWHIFRATDDHTEIALRRLDEIIEEVPAYSPALATRAILTCRRITYCQYDDPLPELREAERLAKLAVSQDETDSLGRVALSRVLMFQGHHEGAIEQARRAIALNPSSSVAATCLGWAYYWSGRASEAADVVDESIRLSPKGPFLDMKVTIKVFCLHALDRIVEAEELGRQVSYSLTAGPIGAMAYLAVLGRQRNLGEAEAVLDVLHENWPLDILRDNWPYFSLGRIRSHWLHLYPDYLSTLLDDLEAAGLHQ